MTQLRERPASVEAQEPKATGLSREPKRGRHYPPEQIDWATRITEARALSWAGATMEEIAAWFNTVTANLYKWGMICPAFLDACHELSSYADDRVEKSLYKQALDGNVSAAIFWLKNRRANNWRDKRDIDIGGTVEHEAGPNMRHLAMGLVALMYEASGETIEHDPRNDGDDAGGVRGSVQALERPTGDDDETDYHGRGDDDHAGAVRHGSSQGEPAGSGRPAAGSGAHEDAERAGEREGSRGLAADHAGSEPGDSGKAADYAPRRRRRPGEGGGSFEFTS